MLPKLQKFAPQALKNALFGKNKVFLMGAFQIKDAEGAEYF